MASGIVVRSIFFSADQQLGVEELAIIACADLVDRGGVQVDEDGAGHIFAAPCLGEERLKGAAFIQIFGVGVGAAVGFQAVLEEVELPGTVPELCARLADVKVENLGD